MLPFILTLIVMSTLIYAGLRVNLYLYATGVLGARHARCLRCRSAAASEPNATTKELLILPFAKTDDLSAQYARRGLLLAVSILAVISIGTLSVLSVAFQ